MSKQTIPARLDEDEAKEIGELAKEVGLDRPALVRQLIRRGYREMRLERALQAYRSGQVSLSRAAEMAGLGMRELLLKVPDNAVELNYDLRELRRDLEGI